MKTRRKPLSILRRDLKKSSGASLRPSVSKLQRKRTGGALSEATTRSKQKLTNGPLLEGKREHGTPGKEKTSGTALISANADMVSKAKKKSKLTSSDSLSGKEKSLSPVKPWSCYSVVDKQAASILEKLQNAQKGLGKRASLKTLVLAPHIKAKQATYKVLCETVKHIATIKTLLTASQVLQDNSRLSESLALVLGYELIFGEGLKPFGPAERALLKVSDQLIQETENLKTRFQVSDIADISNLSKIPEHHRTARVNTLKTSVENVLKILRQSEGSNLKSAEIEEDLPDVLRFKPGTDLHAHPLVASGHLILQSKASCMPAHALSPNPNWHVIDACAAPGNKTTHLASLMNNKGRITAFDKDPKRVKKLQKNIKHTGASNITVICQSFLDTDPYSEEYRDVEGILLDPSCSGSGTANARIDEMLSSAIENDLDKTEEKNEANSPRIKALAKFQKEALTHALEFPNLKRIVYSTCSVYQQENEEVVQGVLELASSKGYKLKKIFSNWKRRGVPIFNGAKTLLRIDPLEDGTEGFFIACFQR